MRRWKLSPTDVESIARWEDYSRAKDEMLVHTDIAEARWNVVESDDKRRSRVNMIAHLLSQVPYEQVELAELTLPERPPSLGYVRPSAPSSTRSPTTRPLSRPEPPLRRRRVPLRGSPTGP